MHALILPAKRGWRWLVEGFAIFQRKPALLCFLLLGYWLTTAVVSAIPVVGRWSGFFLIPAFSVSLMNACRLIDRKEPLPRQLLFSGFHRNLQTLLILGAIHLLSTLAIFGVSALFDGGLLFRLLVLGENLSRETLEEASMLTAVQLTVALFIPVLLAFWFAPVLAAWHDMSAGKSLFFSLVACLRNWRPFLLYSLIVTALCLLIPNLIGALLGSVGGIGQILLRTIAIMVLLPTLYASFYISYRDIFVGLRDVA